jgi:hypothetical protein
MDLTAEDQDKIKKWLETKTSSGLRCFVCGNQRWSIANPAAMTVSIDVHTGRIQYMAGYPLIGLICDNCAHMLWFNAAVMGLKPSG